MPQQPSKAAQTSGWTPVDDSTAPPPGWTAVDEAAPESAASRFGKNLASGAGVVSNEQGKNFFLHPLDTARGMLAAQGELGARAWSDIKRGDIVGGFTHGAEYLLPGIGPNLAQAGDQLESGDIAGGSGRTIGAAIPLVAGSPEARAAVGDIAAPVIRATGRTMNRPIVAPAAGAAADLAHGGHGFAGMVAGHLARKGLSGVFDRMENFGAKMPPSAIADIDPASIPPETHMPGALADVPAKAGTPAAQTGEALSTIPTRSTNPGAPLPATPDASLLQARGLFNGVTSPPDLAAGLGTLKQAAAPGQAGSIAESMKAPPSAEVAPGFKRGSLQQLLDNSVGAKKLEPNVPLRQQFDRVTPTSSPATAKASAATPGMPEGHAPLESSALRSYKYDPAAHEFEAWPTSGDTAYRYGDVRPEAAQAFEDAPSKGKAFQQIKSSGTLVAKRINGKWVPVKR